jgi:hypothetical protein
MQKEISDRAPFGSGVSALFPIIYLNEINIAGNDDFNSGQAGGFEHEFAFDTGVREWAAERVIFDAEMDSSSSQDTTASNRNPLELLDRRSMQQHRPGEPRDPSNTKIPRGVLLKKHLSLPDHHRASQVARACPAEQPHLKPASFYLSSGPDSEQGDLEMGLRPYANPFSYQIAEAAATSAAPSDVSAIFLAHCHRLPPSHCFFFSTSFPLLSKSAVLGMHCMHISQLRHEQPKLQCMRNAEIACLCHCPFIHQLAQERVAMVIQRPQARKGRRSSAAND